MDDPAEPNITSIRILPKGRIYLKLIDEGFDDTQVTVILKTLKPELEAMGIADLNNGRPWGRDVFYCMIGAVVGALTVMILRWVLRSYP